MGTRGAIGFIVDGVEKITYNHYDSYPSALGKKIIEYIVNHKKDLNAVKNIVKNIQLVNSNKKPTIKDIQHYTKIGMYDCNVSDKNTSDWYCLLRNSQGDLESYHNGVAHMIDNSGFMDDSLFCEWAYIINLDTVKLEVYKGFNKNRNASGRYVYKKYHEYRTYYGVKLIKEFNLNRITLRTINTLNKLDK